MVLGPYNFSIISAWNYVADQILSRNKATADVSLIAAAAASDKNNQGVIDIFFCTFVCVSLRHLNTQL